MVKVKKYFFLRNLDILDRKKWSKNVENNQNNSNNGQEQNNNNGREPKRANFMLLLVAAVITLLFVSYFSKFVNGGSEKSITYSDFVTMLEEGQVKSVQISTDVIYIKKVENVEEKSIPCINW